MPFPEPAASFRSRLARIRLLIFDVDGVLTDGRLSTGPVGGRRWNVKDGFAFYLLRETDLKAAICSGKADEEIRERAKILGIEALSLGRMDKGDAVTELMQAADLVSGEALFLGDDLFDLPGMRVAGLGAAPADAVADVRERVDWVLDHAGGDGAARELIQAVLQARGEWDRVTAPYLIGDDRHPSI
jgi:3-deoxy-D-manno-octulosonate 8-phosphate phosphatase (KDO 8-P phosphatase)